MAAGGDPDNISIGPGRLYVAAIGTAEPASASAALPSAWRAIGYTEEGSTFTMDRSFEDIEVAEELEPVDSVNNKTMNMLALSMAEATRQNLALALDGSATGDNDNTPIESPSPGDENKFMVIWDKKEDSTGGGNVRWMFRRCVVTGNIEMAHQKSPSKTLLPVEIKALKPAGSTKAWKCWPDNNGLIS